MPAVQALGIFETLQEKLISTAVKSDEKHVSKKQKKSTNSKSNNATAMLISVYFVEFTNALKLNQHQLRTFSDPVMSIFESFVKPGMVAWIESKTDVESTILPAMQVHSTLITAFFDIYFSKIGSKDQAWLAKTYIQIFEENLKHKTLGSRMAVTTSVCILNLIYISHAQFLFLFT